MVLSGISNKKKWLLCSLKSVYQKTFWSSASVRSTWTVNFVQHSWIRWSWFFFLSPRQNKRMPPSIDREKMFIDLSPVKRCLCWLSLLVSRLHLAQPNQNTNTPLSFGCCPTRPPAPPPSPAHLLLTSSTKQIWFFCLFFLSMSFHFISSFLSSVPYACLSQRVRRI